MNKNEALRKLDEVIELLKQNGAGVSERAALALIDVRASLPAAEQPNIAAAIHYPDCWDQMAYPTLASALNEMLAWFKCSECAAEQPQQAVSGEDIARSIEAAFLEGFFSIETYNDAQLNDEHEAFAKSAAKKAADGSRALLAKATAQPVQNTAPAEKRDVCPCGQSMDWCKANSCHDVPKATAFCAESAEKCTCRRLGHNPEGCLKRVPSPAAPELIEVATAQPNIAAAIHYPDCWDTAAYPTLESALKEIGAFRCSECATAQPNNYHDAYRGARDDMQEWKRRALEAEESCRRLTAALNAENGPTHMGEPAATAQPTPAVSEQHGWKLVPVEPTQAMFDAGDGAEQQVLEVAGNSTTTESPARACWRAMLAAVPAKPADHIGDVNEMVAKPAEQEKACRERELLAALADARWRIANLVGPNGAQGLDRAVLDKIDALMSSQQAPSTAAQERDAARYRFLRTGPVLSTYVQVGGEVVVPVHTSRLENFPEKLDAAIDEALAHKGAQGEKA